MFTKDAFIRALRSAIQAAAGTFSVALLGFLGAVLEWANGQGTEPFPSAISLKFAAIAALISLATGIWSYVQNGLEDWRDSSGLFGAKARPTVQPPQGGGLPNP